MADEPVLLITGASSGIGAATARHAAEAGWRLVLAARSEDKLRELAEELGGEERAVGGALRRPGAGTTSRPPWRPRSTPSAASTPRSPTPASAPSAASSRRTPDFWREMVLTNVYGVALSIRAALPHFLEQGRGHMLLMGSLAGRRALPGSLYSATKWAVTSMGEALRQEVSDTDIKVTVIEPGQVDTPFFHEPKPDALKADDIARAVMYALSQPPHVDVNEVLVRPIRQAL